MFFTGTVSPQRYEYICKKYEFKNDGSQDNEIITKIHRLFLERIRKETGKSVKHWCVTEKGHTNTRRIHLHGLFYAREGQTKWQLTKLLYENWIDGYKYYGRYVNEKTINYVSKYMTKKDEDISVILFFPNSYISFPVSLNKSPSLYLAISFAPITPSCSKMEIISFVALVLA